MADDKPVPCRYCRGDAADLYVLHHFPVGALVAVDQRRIDPLTGPVGHRWEGIETFLVWLRDNGWAITPPDGWEPDSGERPTCQEP